MNRNKTVLTKEKAIEDTYGQPEEDRALKAAAQFIGKDLLPLLGIEGTVKRIAPTEQVYLELRDFLEDFNYEMTDGTWKHLEFESDSITEQDLLRFRAYEAVISYHYGVTVTTYVVCSSGVKQLKNELTQGINTYRIKVIRLKDRNADVILEQLASKQAIGELNRQDMTNLILTPLMDGRLSQLERIQKSFRLLQNGYEEPNRGELMQMQAVLYLLAMKFLTKDELNIVKEELNMTYLGQLLMQDGFNNGFTNGFAEGKTAGLLEGEIHKLIRQICRKLQKNKAPEIIAEELEEDEAIVLEIYRAAKDCGPDFDCQEIYNKLNLEESDLLK